MSIARFNNLYFSKFFFLFLYNFQINIKAFHLDLHQHMSLKNNFFLHVDNCVIPLNKIHDDFSV